MSDVVTAYPFTCPHCGKRLANKHGLARHVHRHTGLKPFSCPLCSKTFSEKPYLTIHERTHSGEKPFECPHCQKRFTSQSNLIQHIRVHRGDRPYACPQCPSRFTQLSGLKCHQRTHSGDRPYSCSVCSRSFAQLTNMRKHESSHAIPWTEGRVDDLEVCRSEDEQKTGVGEWDGQEDWDSGEDNNEAGEMGGEEEVRDEEEGGDDEDKVEEDDDDEVEKQTVHKDARSVLRAVDSLNETEVSGFNSGTALSCSGEAVKNERQIKSRSSGLNETQTVWNDMNWRAERNIGAGEDVISTPSRAGGRRKGASVGVGQFVEPGATENGAVETIMSNQSRVVNYQEPFRQGGPRRVGVGVRFGRGGMGFRRARRAASDGGGSVVFSCSECCKIFSTAGNLKQHMVIHSGFKAFRCLLCDRAFNSKGGLMQHAITHTDSRPYQCDICQKGFNQSGNLRTHRRIHTGERPFECRVCGKSFNNIGNMRTHVKLHETRGDTSGNEETNDQQLLPQPFSCNSGGPPETLESLGDDQDYHSQFGSTRESSGHATPPSSVRDGSLGVTTPWTEKRDKFCNVPGVAQIDGSHDVSQCNMGEFLHDLNCNLPNASYSSPVAHRTSELPEGIESSFILEKSGKLAAKAGYSEEDTEEEEQRVSTVGGSGWRWMNRSIVGGRGESKEEKDNDGSAVFNARRRVTLGMRTGKHNVPMSSCSNSRQQLRLVASTASYATKPQSVRINNCRLSANPTLIPNVSTPKPRSRVATARMSTPPALLPVIHRAPQLIRSPISIPARFEVPRIPPPLTISACRWPAVATSTVINAPVPYIVTSQKVKTPLAFVTGSVAHLREQSNTLSKSDNLNCTDTEQVQQMETDCSMYAGQDAYFRSHSGRAVIRPNSFLCSVCMCRFSSLQNLEQHMLVHIEFR